MWGISKKPVDPLTARERELEAELARLKSKVERLAREEPQAVAPAREADSFHPSGGKPFPRPLVSASPQPAPKGSPSTEPLNDLGVRKYDISAAWKRLVGHLRGPTANNPRMVRMLAAGSIHGLRPLRYERRVARNRFIALFVILLLILWGLGYTYIRYR